MNGTASSEIVLQELIHADISANSKIPGIDSFIHVTRNITQSYPSNLLVKVCVCVC